MRKLHYYLIYLLIVLMNVPVYGQDQHHWNKSRLVTEKVQQKASFRKTLNHQERPNISVRSNPVPMLNTRAITDKTLYGYAMYNLSQDTEEVGIIKFSNTNPGNIQVIGNPNEVAVRSAAEANGVYYAIALANNFPEGFYAIDLETGAANQIADYDQINEVRGAIDMTYDYSTGTMYFITNSDNSTRPDGLKNSALWTVDLKDGSQKMIHESLGESLLTIATNYDGEMYGVARLGGLYKIDPQKGTSILIGETGIDAWYWQSMEFDKGTGELYWASYDMQDNGILYIINTKDGSLTTLGVIGENEEITGLHIPFDLCDPKAPAEVSNLSIKAAANGDKNASITWSNPEKTYDGSALEAISKIEIIRNGDVVHSITTPQTGKEQNWTDNVPASGLYVYKIIAYNNIGAGAPKQIAAFIGHDLPAAVTNTTAKAVNAQTISLTWDAATTGINKGYLDLSSIRYKITRSDGVIIAENQTNTSYEDNTINKLSRYSYTIEVSNADGIGGTSTTNYVINGPALSIPFNADFSEEKNTYIWTCEDANKDGNTFYYDERGAGFGYFGGEEKADEWLISPNIQLKNSKNYKCIVRAQSFSSEMPERFSICLIKNKDLSNAAVLETFEVRNTTPTEFRINFSDIANGDYSIGIHCTSDEFTEGFAVYSVLVDENNDGNVRGDVYDDQENPVDNVIISLEDTEYQATTDTEGLFEIKNVPEGTYIIRCTKLGYKDAPATINIKKLETTNVELDVVTRKVYNVNGTATNEYGEKMKNTAISISGYNTYSTQTGKDGSFKIEGVYEDEKPYNLSASKAFYQPAEVSKVIDKDSSLDFILKDKILPPTIATVEFAEGKQIPTITWTQPGEESTIKKHSGEFSTTFGTEEGDEKVIHGIICKEPMILKSINWLVFSEWEELNVVIMALDEEGNTTSEVLYIDQHAPNNLWEPTHYQLSTPVIAPHGCFVGIGCNEGSLSIVSTYNTEEFPFIEHFNGYMDDYTTGKVEFVEDLGDDYRENFAVDVEGSLLANAEAPVVNYNVYRNDVDLLTPTPLTGLNLDDAAWDLLPDQTYTYEVESVYRNSQKARNKTNEITKDGTGIRNSSLAEVYAFLSEDGTQILFSELVEAAEIIGVDGTLIAKGVSIREISMKKATKGVYIIKMKKNGRTYNQKLIIK